MSEQGKSEIRKGRGAQTSPNNRFHKHQTYLDPEVEHNAPSPRTEFIKDSSKSIVSENDSPDIPFRYSVNAYRGCEHGCTYCYARPTHEYLGYSAGVDFETKILVKENAPELLRQKLMSKSWTGEPITFSGNTDCYQPAERKFELTRRCLQVMAEFRNPASLITKNRLITRDIDLFRELNQYKAILIYISVTTLDPDLCAILEPRTSRPQSRLDAIRELSEAGLPVGVNVAPVIPGLTDHEMPAILKAAAAAGAKHAGYTNLRLPLAVAPIFEDWLQKHKPERRLKVLEAVKGHRGGKLYDSKWGSRMKGEGPVADNIKQMFAIYARKEGLNQTKSVLSSEHFIRPGDQLSFF